MNHSKKFLTLEQAHLLTRCPRSEIRKACRDGRFMNIPDEHHEYLLSRDALPELERLRANRIRHDYRRGQIGAERNPPKGEYAMTEYLKIVDEILAARQIPEPSGYRDKRLLAERKQELQKRAAIAFGGYYGWRFGGKRFALKALAKNQRFARENYFYDSTVLDHPRYFRFPGGRAAAIVGHNYPLSAPEATCAAFAEKHGLVATHIDLPSWYNPSGTHITIYRSATEAENYAALVALRLEKEST